MNKLKMSLIVFILIFVSNSALVESSNINPKIILNGEEEIIVVMGNKYQEQGVVVKGDDILEVNTTGIVIENTIGTYLITYTATDKTGNVSSITRTVKIVEKPFASSENYPSIMNEPVVDLSNSGEVLGVNKFIFTQKLNFGLRNNEVTELHKRVMIDGYLNISAPTGYFGSQTLKAVKDFQLAKGLTVDGIVGPQTRTALNQ